MSGNLKRVRCSFHPLETGNTFYWYVNILLFVSWFLHILLRTRKLLSPIGQWMYASLSLILLLGVKTAPAYGRVS